MAGEAAVIRQTFEQKFSGTPRVFRAPGRVNLIGEHTDYNLGFVLPIAIDMACFTAVSKSDGGKIRVYSRNYDEMREWPVTEVPTLQAESHWSDYVIGVAQQLHKLGIDLLPVDVAIYSTVPVGSGLSSSASLEIASALALLFGREMDRTELALLAQRAEIEFVGVPCGIMDQYVSVFGEEHKAVKIDCRSITHQTASLPEDVLIVAVNSMVKHALGDSAYKTRVKECAEAVAIIQQKFPQIQSLRDVRSSDLESVRDAMSDVVYCRARHVTTEDERVMAFTEAADDQDLLKMGRLFLASHRSLQKDYEVSCEELDFLVDTAAEMIGVYGARMTGGGFGGCSVNLVAPDHIEAFEENITEAYRSRYRITPQIYRCIPATGAGELYV